MAIIRPEDVDWAEADDLEVQLSAHAGLEPAIVEAKRRGIHF